MSKPNNAHSVSRKLLNIAKARRVDYNIVLIWYGLERFLYRLSKSRHSNNFILKGAMLFAVWAKQPFRPTKDLDLMAYGDASEDYLRKVFTDICKIKVEDGIVFDANRIEVDEIRQDQEYDGLRVKLPAKLGNAKMNLQIDIGFGDAVTPAPIKIQYPVLLELPAPSIRAYPKETIVAEKLHAMFILGIANSRMKDFYDLWIISKQLDFDDSLLAKSIRATFERRNTPLPEELPLALTDDFSSDAIANQRWSAFSNKLETNTPPLNQIIKELRNFLIIPLDHARTIDQ